MNWQISGLFFRLCAACVLCILAVGGELPARTSFHFKNFSRLATGDRFQIIALTGYAAGSKIGTGKIQQLTARELRLNFSIQTIASGRIDGRIYLKHLGAQGRHKERFRLQYSGSTTAGPESATEEVLADGFLIQNGILAFHFFDRLRFFQLSVDTKGRNKFITNWGAARLEVHP